MNYELIYLKSLIGQKKLTLSLEPLDGGLTLFYAFINGVKVISDEASKKRTWTGMIPDTQIKIKVRVFGVNEATFKLGIDLPGTADDQALTLKLSGGYYEADFTI